MRRRGAGRRFVLLGTTLAFACAGCTPAGLESGSDDAGTGDATAGPSGATSVSAGASPDGDVTSDEARTVIDLAAGWERLDPIATVPLFLFMKI